MWRNLYKILLNSGVLIWMLYLEIKCKAHKKQTIVIKKLNYWGIWSLIVVGNIISIWCSVRNIL